ncbi:hypothetical protein ATANTOWER_001834 [Ataeniobius toweri]|uniref:Uncharacterized protein n=1 Tax=Ataeniobius toweri TaxID=208326 RepID=A0ABU7AVD8_9TELE|nr:hypothetical protein [Ataeniobius toweri]
MQTHSFPCIYLEEHQSEVKYSNSAAPIAVDHLGHNCSHFSLGDTSIYDSLDTQKFLTDCSSLICGMITSHQGYTHGSVQTAALLVMFNNVYKVHVKHLNKCKYINIIYVFVQQTKQASETLSYHCYCKAWRSPVPF